MKSFFWKFVICITPVVLACLIVWNAYVNDTFKRGVDLNGGTILVYEMDIRKAEEKQKEGEEQKGSSEREMSAYFREKAGELADALKRRIDPTATYNIIIRPAGTEGRVEIILPTGGSERAADAEKAWQTMLKEVAELYDVKKLTIPRGRTEEVVEQIQSETFWRNWQNKLFASEKSWDALLKKIEDRWVQLSQPARGPEGAEKQKEEANKKEAGKEKDSKEKAGKEKDSKAATKMDHLRKIPVGHVKELVKKLEKDLPDQTAQGIEAWIRQRAWEQLIDQLIDWPVLREAYEADLKKELKGKNKDKSADVQAALQTELKKLQDELYRVPPDSFSELVGRIETKGHVLTQAALDVVAPLLGTAATASDLVPRDKLQHFINEHYGPSEADIQAEIKKHYSQASGHSKDLTVEEVQRIKDLVSKVGALEFRILANSIDDKQAIDDAKDMFENPERWGVTKDEMEKRAINGEPPPSPHEGDELKEYNITLANGEKAKVTYSWVELGKQERRTLGLNNAAKTSGNVRQEKIWDQVHSQPNKALKIEDPTSATKQFLWQGALFFWRECRDRNLPDKDRREKKYEYYVLSRNPIVDPKTGEAKRITGDLLRSAYTDIGQGRPVVSFVFTAEGGSLFGELTGQNIPSGSGAEETQVKRHLAIILDGLVMSAPTINSKITTHGQISGDFTRKEVDGLVNILRSGALPATLKPQPVSESTIGALLGRDTINAGVNAVIWAFVAVVVFMIFYYRFAGVVACIALFANLILTVGFMVAVQATFTLSGLAGLVLMLGMAVDANVLIYERLREERDRGASLALAIRNGYERAFPTIIDTHLTSIFTAIVLYAMGNDQLKGFAISLTVGLIISLFTSLYVTHVIFDFWLSRGWLHNLSMMRLLSRPNINFMRIRYLVFGATSAVTIAGLVLFLARVPKDLNIDFKGGTAFSAQLRLDKEGEKVVQNEARSVSDLRTLLEEPRQKALLDVVSVEQVDEDGREYKIVYANPSGGEEVYPSVNLANIPEGETKAEREANVQERAGELPDWSVEMLFPSFAMEEEGKDRDESRFFTIRTSEMERELVQTVINRLLREKGDKTGKYETLLNRNEMHVDASNLKQGGRTVQLTFTDPTGKATETSYASPMAVKSLLHTELRRLFPLDTQGKLAVRFELIGEGESREGRFNTMTVRFDDIKEGEVSKITDALNQAQVAYNQRPQPERLENFDPEMAADARLQALGAIFVSWLAIILYLWFRFGRWTFGLAAVLCLVHDLFFTLGLVASSYYFQGTWIGQLLMIEDFKLDLTAVAALLTLVGYSVADTIVVFDRIREVRGKDPHLTPKIVNDSINQTLSRTLLTSGTTFVVVVVLYFFGGPGIHLFAFIMSVGVILGTVSSIYVASPLLLMLGEGRHVEARGRLRNVPSGATV